MSKVSFPTVNSSASGPSLTTTLSDLVPPSDNGGGSSRPSTAGRSSAQASTDLISVDVELVEKEATTTGDAGLSAEDLEARQQLRNRSAINDANLPAVEKLRLTNVLRGAMPFSDLANYSQHLHLSRSVTLLLISTFTDFQAERHYFHTEVFPDLRNSLRSDANVELNVVDMWLGIDDEKSVTPLDWHNFSNFLIGQGRTGSPLICVFLSGHKYGQPVISPVFDENSVQILTEFCLPDQLTSKLVADALWPDIGQNNPTEEDSQIERRFVMRQEALGTSQLHALSYLIASASVKRPELAPFVASGPELLFNTLLNHFNPDDISLIVFSRKIAGLRENAYLPVCRPYCDFDADSPADFCQIRLKQFQEKLGRIAPSMASRVSLELKISDLNGVNYERHTKFNKHLAESGRLLFHSVKDSGVVSRFREKNLFSCLAESDKFIGSSENALDTLVREATIHLMFAHEHASECEGRDDFVSEIVQYIENHESNSNTFCKPLGIIGPAGSGLSTTMSAVVATVTQNSFREDKICIPRFANLTPKSTDLNSLLRGMLLQLAYIIGGVSRANRELNSPDDLGAVKNRFIHELQTLKYSSKVVFVLDGFHSLRSDWTGVGDFIDWLPSVLSERIRVVVSLKQEKHEAIAHFISRYGEGCVMQIQDFIPSVANELLKTAFTKKGQQLMYSQWQALRTAIDSIAEMNGGGVSAPYLALIREAALRWHTFTSVSSSYFGFTVNEELERVFSLFELRNGVTFTRHTLAYLTAAGQRGLTLAELSDVLALDNFVLHSLNDGETGIGHFSSDNEAGVEATVYIFPSARVPALALYRLLFEVNPFLAQRTVNDFACIVWADSLMVNFASSRYLESDPELARMVSSNLAEYYLGSWGNKTPKDLRLSVCDNNTSKTAIVSSHSVFSQNKAVRYVISQPLCYTECRTPAAVEANIRRLNCLPYYFLAANRHRDLCSNVLFNLDWLLAKISSLGVDATLHDYHEAIHEIRKSNLISPIGVDEISIIRDAIRFSESVISIRPNLLPGLLLARLLVFQHSARMAALYKNVCSLLNQCDSFSAVDVQSSLVPVVSCLDTPGSPLIYSAIIKRKGPVTAQTSALNVMPVQGSYAFIFGLKLDVSTSARFWSACGCNSLGAGWFCAPIKGLPQGPFYKLNTRHGQLFAVIADRQILQIYHIETGELIFEVDLLQQIEVKQFCSTDRYVIIIPGVTAVSTVLATDQLAGNNRSRPSSSTTSRSLVPTDNDESREQTTITQPVGPIIIDMVHKAVAHRFTKRPEIVAISAGNDYFAFTADDEIYVYQLPLMECIHTFRTEMPPVFLHIIPQSIHGRSDEVRIFAITNHGSVLMAIIHKKVSKSFFKAVLPYRESLLNPVMQVDTLRGGAMGLIESPKRLFLIGLRDGSLLGELNLPEQIAAPRKFTAAAFACSEQFVASALDTGHIVLFRIGGDPSSVRIINPSNVATPFTGHIITHMHGPTCCWRILALSSNGDEAYLRCWDVERLSSLSHITNHSHVIASGSVHGIFTPSPYVDGVASELSPFAVGLLSQTSPGSTQNMQFRVVDLKSRSIGDLALPTMEWNQRVSQIVLSPDADYCLVIDTDRNAILYSANGAGRMGSYQFSQLAAFSGITDAFFSSPTQESGRLFETIFIAITDSVQIDAFRLGYGNVELLHSTQVGSVKCPIFLNELGCLCFLTTVVNEHRSVEDVKLCVFQGICRPEAGAIEAYHLFQIWRTEGNAHWEFAELMRIESAPTQLLVFFTLASLSVARFSMLKHDHVGCFDYDVQTKEMVWSSLGMAAFKPNSPVIPEALFLPRHRIGNLNIDSHAKHACDVDLGILYDLQFGTRSTLSKSCCIESFRFLLDGTYFCVLTADRRKVQAYRTSDQVVMAEFNLFGFASCLEVVPCRDLRSNRRVITIGMEDGRLVALSCVADLCDPVFENLTQFRKAL